MDICLDRGVISRYPMGNDFQPKLEVNLLFFESQVQIRDREKGEKGSQV